MHQICVLVIVVVSNDLSTVYSVVYRVQCIEYTVYFASTIIAAETVPTHLFHKVSGGDLKTQALVLLI